MILGQGVHKNNIFSICLSYPKYRYVEIFRTHLKENYIFHRQLLPQITSLLKGKRKTYYKNNIKLILILHCCYDASFLNVISVNFSSSPVKRQLVQENFIRRIYRNASFHIVIYCYSCDENDEFSWL